jgi:hypothetical protein
MLRRELQAARIGQFVLAAGEIGILDLPMLRQLWELPIIRATVRSGSEAASNQVPAEAQSSANRHARRRENRQPKRPQTITTDPVEFLLETVKHFPHAVQVMLTTPDRLTVWCSIREDSLVGSSADLMLKHGATLSGTWSALAFSTHCLMKRRAKNRSPRPRRSGIPLWRKPLRA